MAASGILDLRSHFGLERPQVEPEEEEEEPVHPLDLRICKVNESISRNNHASNNVFNDALQARHQESEAGEVVAQASNTTSVSPPVATTIDSLRLRSPMQSAFPGQIPPDRRYSEASSPQGHHHPYEQNPMLTLRPLNELQAKVQQHMQQHRYHPYGDYKHIRQQVSSGNDHQRQASGGNAEHRPSKSAFLRHVLQHRDVSSHHQNHYHQKVAGQSFGTNSSSGAGMKAEPVDHAMEIDRRMEALDQRLRLHDHPVKNSGYYSPPESPVTGNNPCLPPPLCFDPELAVRRHRDFLRKLHEGHFVGNAAAAAAAAAAAGNYFGPQSPLSPPDEQEYAVNRSPPPLEPLSPLACETFEGASQKGKRGRPRKHAIKIPLPPLYVFIRNLLHNRYYNPRVVSWVCEYQVKFDTKLLLSIYTGI